MVEVGSGGKFSLWTAVDGGEQKTSLENPRNRPLPGTSVLVTHCYTPCTRDARVGSILLRVIVHRMPWRYPAGGHRSSFSGDRAKCMLVFEWENRGLILMPYFQPSWA